MKFFVCFACMRYFCTHMHSKINHSTLPPYFCSHMHSKINRSTLPRSIFVFSYALKNQSQHSASILFFSCVLMLFIQRVFYFPLKPKLSALLQIKKYYEMCQHEFTRPRNADLITDIYDGEAWKEFMGPCHNPNDRIGLVSCGDGIPAFAAGTHSLKPWMHKNMSLPPGVRSKIKYMLLWMLLHESIKPEGQRKYFDFAIDYELKDLYTRGIHGVKVKIFTLSMDTKGREEISGKYLKNVVLLIFIVLLSITNSNTQIFIGMQTCQAYQSCPVCTHAWSPPLSRGCVADGYRRFLEMRDPGRQRKVKYKGLSYEYKDVCARKVPKTRDTEFVQSVCAVATVKKPQLGHKFAPIFSRLPGFDWQRIFGAPEVMHGIYVLIAI